MRTRVARLYGAHDLRVEEQPISPPGPGEVLLAMAAGGICGSDLHYYQDGGIGTIRVREPIIIGHEAAGTVLTLGDGVEGLVVGDKVALNPSHPCGTCKFCREGLPMHCLEMRFKGSAIRLPHEQGLFRDRITYLASQCVKVAPGISVAEAACSEPLAVCVHACNRGGALLGKKVLVTGSGPIGVLCAALAARGGAAEVVVTDLQDAPLAVAEKMGATHTINVARDGGDMADYAADKGHFDLAFECTAAAPAIHSAIAALRPLGTLVQVGVAGDTPLPLNMVVAKEIDLRGTHRFHAEFAEATGLINRRAIDVRPMITHTFPMDQAAAALAVAGDRSQAVKVHLAFAA